MVTVTQKKKFQAFAKRWEGRGYEKGDTAQFWIELLGLLGYSVEGTSPFEHHLANGGFIDVWLHDAGVLVEQKALGVDLDKHELRQGQLKTPLEQALHYADDLPLNTQPRWVVTCNFSTFRVYDRDAHAKSQLAANGFEFTLAELGEHPEYLAFITDSAAARQEKELQVSIRAGELVGQLYDRLRTGYLDPDSEESMHALNVLCVRIVFCLFCEDSDLFEKDAFYRYLLDVPTPYMRDALRKLFRALDTPLAERDPYDTTVKGFPYVNGGLFREEVQVPNIDEETKRFLLEDISAAVNWSEISPTIFGGIFEGTLNPTTRRQGGMHYTSPENIHKVIDPLFLDGLKAEFTAIQTDAGLTPRQKKNRYAKLHRRICDLTFFDPACGSGNFLTETYLSLRKLEDALLHELRGGQMGFGLGDVEESGTRVSLSQFYGIEINDFAVTVAETALWISRLKANGQTMMLLDVDADDFPLSESAQIVQGNALRMDWNDVLPAGSCSYVMGNPPFVGQKQRSADQRRDIMDVWKTKSIGLLDYVTCWYRIAATYLTDNPSTSFAFVSTNSITQGDPVPLLFKPLLDEGWHIRFAHKPFKWSSEGTGTASVHVVIIGMDRMDNQKLPPTLYEYENVDGPYNVTHPENINGYLLDAPNVFVTKRSQPLGGMLPKVVAGPKAADNGHLIVNADAYDEAMADPIAAKYVRRFKNGKELINNIDRWCLWLVDATQQEIVSSPFLSERVGACQAYRESQGGKSSSDAYKLRATPHLFRPSPWIPDRRYLAIPTVFSGRRVYATCDWLDASTIPGVHVFIAPDEDGFAFAMIESSLYMAWQKAVGGRTKSDCNFSSTVVWNNLPIPDMDHETRERICEAGHAIMEARANYLGWSLAELYDPDKMPGDLLAAHRALDAVVEVAYGVDFGGDETRIVSHLFDLYAEKTRES